MGLAGTLKSWVTAATQFLRLVARPVRDAQGDEGVVLEPYRGYGSQTEVFLIGRVFRQSQANHANREYILTQLRDIGRPIARRAVANVSFSTAVRTSRKGCTVALFQRICCALFMRLATSCAWPRSH